MASLSSLPWILVGNGTAKFPSLSPSSRNKHQSSTPRNPRYGTHYMPCKASSSNEDQNPNSEARVSSSNKFDRRDVLFGIGGLAGGAALNGSKPASADPVSTPNISNCGPSIILKNGEEVGRVNCCPPSPDDIFDFVPPPITRNPRVRTPAHLMKDEQLNKFKEAVWKMKHLDPLDPRSFSQQANIHCAYCNVGYKQEGFPGIDLQVHYNWLFFPFHRAYLYFFEKILGHLIDDPTFTIPFWNWDHPDGMYMPDIYDDKESPLYDENRNKCHRPPRMLDLSYSRSNEYPKYDIVDSNLKLMYRQMFTNAKTSEMFMGKPIRAGEISESGMGSIENIPHNKIHVWGGNPDNPNGEDMGNFYSSGNDMLFYGLHGNVDRMWCLWKQLGNGKHKDFTDTDWLDSSFVFYDENKIARRIYVRDCLDTKILGYVYEERPLPWLDTKPVSFRPKQLGKTIPKKSDTDTNTDTPKVTFPLVLDSKKIIVVKRPDKSRSRKEKNEEDERLVIEGIQFDRTLEVCFEVFINLLKDGDENNISPGNSEAVGIFANVPHTHNHSDQKLSLSFGITEALEDLNCDDDDTVSVTLVPRVGVGKVTIGGIKIKLRPLF